MPEPGDREPNTHGSGQAASCHEDVEEHIHRMADEGGGVVDQNDPAGAPILRNDLVDVDLDD
jgi:hypothetical protein